MRYLYEQLNIICVNYFYDEKLLIVPSHTAGHTFLRAFVKAGYSFLNLKAVTLQDIVENYNNDSKKTLITDLLSKYFMMSAYKRLYDEGELKYFKDISITPQLAGELVNALNEIRQSDINISSLHQTQFVSKDKYHDLMIIFNNYLEIINLLGYIDEAGVLHKAISSADIKSRNKEGILIFFDNYNWSELEKKFINKLGEKYTFEQIKWSPIENEDAKEEYLSSSDFTTNRYRLPWIIDIKKAPPPIKDNSLELFRAYGYVNEVKTVFQDLKNKNIKLDKAVMYYSTSEPYSQIVYDLSKQLSIPVTYGNGISILNTCAGKLLNGLIKWVESGFSYAIFHQLLVSGIMKVKDDIINPFLTAKVLRNLKIGSGKDRYLNVIDREIKVLNNSNGDYYKLRLNEVLHIKSFIIEIFKMFPQCNEDQELSSKQLFSWFIYIIDNFTSITSEVEVIAKNELVDKLQSIVMSQKDKAHFLDDLLDLLVVIVEEARVFASGPKPGYFHICNYKVGMWVGRYFNYFIGLSSYQYPGQVLENPVLLDCEKEKISNKIPLSEKALDEKKFQMVCSLSSIDGNVLMGYSYFDVADNREHCSSFLLLQVYRLLTGSPTKDYSDLNNYLENVRGYIVRGHSSSLTVSDWWLYQSEYNNDLVTLNNVSSVYHGLRAGLKAEACRISPNFTQYNGKVVNDSSIHDTENNKFILTCTQLETLAKCPFKYFLKYSLRIEPAEELEQEVHKWLSPSDRGTMLHDIFEKYTTEMNFANEDTVGLKAITNIAREILFKWRQFNPPNSELVYKCESQEILDTCKVFLETENLQYSKCQFIGSEISFGIGDEPPIDIELEDMHIKIRGKIDRVDKLPNGNYRITDYKTGKPYGYDDISYFKNGTQIQHALYTLAFEEKMKRDDSKSDIIVEESAYFFPSLKGEGQIFIRPQNRRAELISLLRTMLNIITHGYFSFTDEKERCKYCDYKNVCERERFISSMKDMYKDLTIEELNDVRGLKQYV